MTKTVKIYFFLLVCLILGWMAFFNQFLSGLIHRADLPFLLGILCLYLSSHLLRLLRLGLLVLDERRKASPLMVAHIFTTFPCSLIPFKIGELLRLAAFFHVFDYRRKALGIWIAERFGDVIVITALILSLYLFKMNVPNSMRLILIIFSVVSVFGLLSIFAIAKVFVYLNRHLVLSSHSKRGLFVLRTSFQFRCLENDIYKALEGRLTAFILLSISIWSIEIITLSLFLTHFYNLENDFATMFTEGLLATLPGGGTGYAGSFGLYQTLSLALMSLCPLVLMWFVSLFNLKKI